MQTDNRSPGGESRPSPVQITTLAMRSMGQVYDMNLAAARSLLQTQARTAAALGLPDWSGMFDQADDRARQMFSTSADQLVQATQRANEAAAELQRQINRVIGAQTSTMVQTMQQGIEQMGQQTEAGLNQLCESAREQADNTERMTQSVSDEVLQTLRQGSEGMRDAMRQGGEQMRDTLRQGTEQGEQATKEAGQAGRDLIVDANGNGLAAANGQGADDKSARRAKGGMQVGGSPQSAVGT